MDGSKNGPQHVRHQGRRFAFVVGGDINLPHPPGYNSYSLQSLFFSYFYK